MFHLSERFDNLIQLSSFGRKFLRRDRFVKKKVLSNEEVLIVQRQKINFDRDEKAAAIYPTKDSDQLFGHIFMKASSTPQHQTL